MDSKASHLSMLLLAIASIFLAVAFLVGLDFNDCGSMWLSPFFLMFPKSQQKLSFIVALHSVAWKGRGRSIAIRLLFVLRTTREMG